jgi:ABC-2 type transport system permease protein
MTQAATPHLDLRTGTSRTTGLGGYLTCLSGITKRELLKFVSQKERFFSALVRPLIWLFIFAAGFRSALGVSIIPPYQTYVPYEDYVAPGLAVMIQLFAGMQSSLSMVYDREVGSMRVLLTSPFPRWSLLLAKLLASVIVSVAQVYVFFVIAGIKVDFAGTFNVAQWSATWDSNIPPIGYLFALPALILAGLMLGAIGLLISSQIKQLENFASVMNFVIFPMFFASSALYPLWKMREASEALYWICLFNPFTHAVELVRFALYLQFEQTSFAVVAGVTLAAFILSVFAYDPGRGMLARRGGPGD